MVVVRSLDKPRIAVNSIIFHALTIIFIHRVFQATKEQTPISNITIKFWQFRSIANNLRSGCRFYFTTRRGLYRFPYMFYPTIQNFKYRQGIVNHFLTTVGSQFYLFYYSIIYYPIYFIKYVFKIHAQSMYSREQRKDTLPAESSNLNDLS